VPANGMCRREGDQGLAVSIIRVEGDTNMALYKSNTRDIHARMADTEPVRPAGTCPEARPCPEDAKGYYVDIALARLDSQVRQLESVVLALSDKLSPIMSTNFAEKCVDEGGGKRDYSGSSEIVSRIDGTNERVGSISALASSILSKLEI